MVNFHFKIPMSGNFKLLYNYIVMGHTSSSKLRYLYCSILISKKKCFTGIIGSYW